MAATSDPDEVLRSTTGKTNFQRIARLLIRGGTTLLREIFDGICPPSNLPTILKKPATKKQLKSAKLTKPQWDCLYPSPGVYGQSVDFDVTLLFRLFRTICNLTPPATGWDALPTNIDHSLVADLARIKYYRNSVYGHGNMEIRDDSEFLSLWQEISGALVRIAGQISPVKKHEWQDAIDKFLKEPLTAEDERNVEELLSWYKSDIDVKESLEELKVITKEEMKGVHGLLEGLETTYREDAQVTRDMLAELYQLICSTSGSSNLIAGHPGHLTRKSTIGSSPQVGASEELSALEEATCNGRIVCESEGGVNEMNQKYEKLKALQDELGDQILRTWDISKRVVAMNNDYVTKVKEHNRTIRVKCVGGIVSLTGGSLSLGSHTCCSTCPTLGPLGLILFIGGSLCAIVKARKLQKREPELLELEKELSQTCGQLKEASYVAHKKMESFAQCLADIVEFCREHPNELVVLRECGHVSTQDILRDINTFRSRLADNLKNSEEIHEEGILGEEEEEEAIVSMNKQPGVMNDDSCAGLEDKESIMKLIRLITAPVIVTTGKMKQ
ncbi:uncharacterized protein [Montipora foliosa]|uniref:uncharacterized protein n=1 Tax=Montipora foliosa TaxID=591990 RepID=UPI0035F13A71